VKARLPKEMRGFGFPRLFEVDLNDFDIERILSDVFYLVVSHGRQRGRTPNDPKTIARYRDVLAAHPDLIGFSNDSGKRLLDGWLRAAVIRTASATRGRTGEQIDYLRPLTIAVYKAGFPDSSRQRNVPGFLHGAMLDAVESTDGRPATERLKRMFLAALGRGILVGDAPTFAPAYDDGTNLDIHVLLGLAYLDGFEPVLASGRKPRAEHSSALPDQARAIGRRLLCYLESYGATLPTTALARGFLALANLELFVYSSKLFAATVELNRTGALPAAMGNISPSPPDIYCDFTAVRGGTSDELARACVERDLEALGAFSEASIRLRTIERYARRSPALAEELDALGPDTPDYLMAITRMADHERVQQWAEFEFERIKEETVSALGEDIQASVASQFEATRRASEDSLVPTVALIAAAQRRNHVLHLTAWFHNAGGLRSSYGLLAGKLRGKRTWRYVISDDLLATLVLLAHADPSNVSREGRGLPLPDFLSYLERSYGVIVDRPPRFLDGTAARAGARENLASLKRKLRQMNFFSELSDDFSAQYLTLPDQARP
jgi:hypothetical protein